VPYRERLDVIVDDLATRSVRAALNGFVTRNIVFAPGGDCFYVSDNSLGTREATSKMNELTERIEAMKLQAVDETPSDDGREAVERAITLAANHEQHSYDDDKTRFHEIRRELRTAFQKSIRTIKVSGEIQIGSRTLCGVLVEFTSHDLVAEHYLERDANPRWA